MPNWPSDQAGANILKLAIAEKFGLDAEVRELGTMLAFAGMETGEVDVYVVRDNSGREQLFPALSDVVLDINPSAGTMTVRPLIYEDA